MSQELRKLCNEGKGTTHIGQNKLCHDTVGIFVCEFPLQPRLVAFLKRQVCLCWIDNLRARIDACFSRIRLDQGLSEAVDCRASELIEVTAGMLEIALLIDGKTFGKRLSKITWNFAPRQGCREAVDTLKSSLAANSVKVIAAIFFGSTPPHNRTTTRPANKDVFPEPAPASTKSDRLISVSAESRASRSEVGSWLFPDCYSVAEPLCQAAFCVADNWASWKCEGKIVELVVCVDSRGQRAIIMLCCARLIAVASCASTASTSLSGKRASSLPSAIG